MAILWYSFKPSSKAPREDIPLQTLYPPMAKIFPTATSGDNYLNSQKEGKPWMYSESLIRSSQGHSFLTVGRDPMWSGVMKLNLGSWNNVAHNRTQVCNGHELFLEAPTGVSWSPFTVALILNNSCTFVPYITNKHHLNENPQLDWSNRVL